MEQTRRVLETAELFCFSTVRADGCTLKNSVSYRAAENQAKTQY
ncbi:hypothetical protein [Reticulibacter mediterranei]|nr:hypothetical protein [Reticulibacter mediterranei]